MIQKWVNFKKNKSYIKNTLHQQLSFKLIIPCIKLKVVSYEISMKYYNIQQLILRNSHEILTNNKS